MGMFDEYLPDPPIECPNCGAGHLRFQGKDGPCDLLVWRQGFAAPVGACDEVERSAEYLSTWRLPQVFSAYGGSCESCGRPTGLELCGFAPDGVWTTTEYLPSLVGARDIGDGWLQCTSCSDAWERIGTRRSHYCCGCGSLAIVQAPAAPQRDSRPRAR